MLRTALRSRGATLLALLYLCFSPATYGEVSVLVTDSEGAPIKDAAVVLGSERQARPNSHTTRIAQRNAEFVPAVSVVAAGSSVDFPNFDRARHHVYSFSKAKAFEIELYKGTPSDPVLFETPGIVTIGCNVHDWMYGVVYVVDSPFAATTDDRGVAVFSDLAPGAYSIDVWHPRRREMQGDAQIMVSAQGSGSASATLTLHPAAERPKRPAPITRRPRR
jgi:plastocyanin